MPQLQNLQPLCMAYLVPKFMTLRSGIKAQVGPETTIEPHDLVYYLGLVPEHHGQKAKFLNARPLLSVQTLIVNSQSEVLSNFENMISLKIITNFV